jgi:hypothetical protein
MRDSDVNFFSLHPENDSEWSEEQWKGLLDLLVQQGIFNWREVTSLALGHLNPSQVGTSIASNKNFQAHFPPRQTWMNVRHWYFNQNGCCADCNTRLELQADHLIPKEIVGAVTLKVFDLVNSGQIKTSDDALRTSVQFLDNELTGYREFLRSRLKTGRELPEFSRELQQGIAAGIQRCIVQGISDRKIIEGVADQLPNMVLRCRRCNVVRRPSHKNGGLAFLTTEAALMWILFVKRPAKYSDFEKLCRSYGMTMANIRFQEAWAMAKWLNQQGSYHISEDCQYY